MKRILIACSIFIFFAGLIACKDANFEQMVEANKKVITEVSFKKDVWPIVQIKCGLGESTCHSSPNADSGFKFEGYETVKQKQDDKGKFFRAINWENLDPLLNMPQNRNKLDQASLNLIKKWIDTGMPNN